MISSISNPLRLAYIRNVIEVQVPSAAVQVGREVCVCKIAFALPKPGKVKPEHCKALVSQSLRDSTRRVNILVARKAMGKNGYAAATKSMPVH